MDRQVALSPCVGKSCFGANEIFENPEWPSVVLRPAVTNAFPRTPTADDRTYEASRLSAGPIITPPEVVRSGR